MSLSHALRAARSASVAVLSGLLFLASLTAHAASGTLVGTSLTRIPGGNDQFDRALAQPDGRMLLVGSALSGAMRFAVTRFEADGTLSASFGSNGTALVAPGNGDAEAWAAALQPDGRILVAGSAVVENRQRFAIARLNPGGTLDTTFNGTGFATTAIGVNAAAAFALALQPDGRIVAGGYSTASSGKKVFTLARYNADGTLDATFGSGGIAARGEAVGDEIIRSLGIQSDGRIVAAGSGAGYLAMGRFLPNGQHDLTWGAASNSRILGGHDLVVLPDDKVAIAGTVPDGAISMLGVLRMTREGNIDATWGPGNACSTPCPGIAVRAVNSSATARGIVRQPDGRIVVSGETVTPTAGSATVIARFTAEGAIDSTFGSGGATVVGQGSSPLPTAGMRVEESDAAVTFAGAWTRSDSRWGWSGGSAMQSTTAGATVSIPFVGTSIRWIGARGRGMGIALVRVDGGPAREVDLFARPTDEVHTPIFTVHDLSNGPHTLTIEVTGRKNNEAQSNVVVVDAFDVQPGTTVSHWQDTDPDLRFSAGWTKSSLSFPWSGSGVSNQPELPVTAQETQTAGANVVLPFRGTAIAWIGYRGPDAGIAQVQVDGGTVHEVDLYAPTAIYQPVVFTATGLADANHTLTIQATGRMNPASSAARVVVDAFDITTPGRRYEEYEPSIEYRRPINADGSTGPAWTPHNDARVWSEGGSATNNAAGATATFRFTGTSVRWIGCRKGSCSGRAKVFIDDVFVREVSLSENYPIEGYQKTVFRADDLAPGPHTLRIEVTSTNGGYVVVDAFDVHSPAATIAGAGSPDAALVDRTSGVGLAMRPDGRFVVAGIMSGPATFGTGKTLDSLALAFTADGAIDGSFNGVGSHVRSLGHLTAEAMASARQADGKLVVAGMLANRIRVPIGGESPGGLLARYLADGTLDTTFAGVGYSAFDWPAGAVAIQPDGRIVLGGWKLTNQGGSFAPSIAVARYLPDGTIDGSFGAGGLAVPTPNAGEEQLHDIAIQPDGRIVGAGTKLSGFNFDALFVRLTSAGALDASFNGTGKRVASMHPDGDQLRALLLQPDGRIVGAGFGFNSAGAGVGSAFMATRLNADGSTDTSFGSNGVATVPFEGATAAAFAAALQADGGIVLAGAAGPAGASNFALARLSADGSADTGFGSGGRVVTDFEGDDAINALAVLASGKIVAAGSSSGDFVAAQYLGNGTPDTTFGSGGSTIFPMADQGADVANALTIGADSTLYVAGTGSGLLALARLTREGESAPAITSAASATFTVASASSFAVTASGTPAPALALAGTLPAGVTFNASTGALAGTPALGTVGSYTVTLRATNGVPPDAAQAFTLVVARAAQAISFAPLPDRSATSPPFAVSASASSGLAVAFSSLTPAVCTVSGATVSLVASGTCTLAADQPGDANFTAAARVTRSFSVISSASPGLSLAPASLDFGVQSMGTTSPAQVVTLTNTGAGTVSISAITLTSSQFAQSNDCASLAPAASCTVRVVFSPAVAGGTLNATVPIAATLSVASNAPGSPHTSSLAGSAHKSLVSHYYRSILGRAPDGSGLDFWQAEAARLAALGANVNEAWLAMAAGFFASPEYIAFGRGGDAFVADLYKTFFNRAPEPEGLAFWTGQLSNGLPREVLLSAFMFSPEFAGFTRAIFGNTAARAEVDTVGDFYRGLLARLPDDGGFQHWVRQFREAQCRGADAVRAQADAMSALFIGSAEYAGRNRTNAQYVGDLYNAFLRRGGDLEGVRFWIAQLDSGATTREALRGAFLASREFAGRIESVIAQGCLP